MRNIFIDALIGVGGFLMGTSFGLIASSDCSTCDKRIDVWDENDANVFVVDSDGEEYISRKCLDDIVEQEVDRRVNELKIYQKLTTSYSSIKETDEKPTEVEESSDMTIQNLFDIVDESEDETDEPQDGSYTSSPTKDESGNIVRRTSEGIIEVKNPEVISYESYANECRDFSQSTLTYFSEDDVLCTELNEVIHNVDELVGSDALVSFGKDSYDDDTVYVRNTQLASDFEIIRKDASYQEEVLGFDDPEVYSKAKKAFGLD